MEIRGRLLLDLIGLWMRMLTINDGERWQCTTTSGSPGAPSLLPSKQDWNTMRDKGTEWGSQEIMSPRCLEGDICFWLKRFLYWIQLPFLQDTQQEITSIYGFQYVSLRHRQRLFGAQWKCNHLKIKTKQNLFTALELPCESQITRPMFSTSRHSKSWFKPWKQAFGYKYSVFKK